MDKCDIDNKDEDSVQQHKHDSSESTQCGPAVTMVTSLQANTCSTEEYDTDSNACTSTQVNPLTFDVVLSQEDNDDMTNVLQKFLGDAPEGIQTLLKAQLQNLKVKSPTQHRWDK